MTFGGNLVTLVLALACLAEAPEERRQVTLVFDSFRPRPPAQAVLTKTTKASTKHTKSAHPAHNGGDLPKTFHQYGESAPPFPQQIPQNEESSGSGTVGGQT
jgi:hypothetical protein